MGTSSKQKVKSWVWEAYKQHKDTLKITGIPKERTKSIDDVIAEEVKKLKEDLWG